MQAPTHPKVNSPKKQSLGKKNFKKTWAINGFGGGSPKNWAARKIT
jgi:hypothetical protein